MLRVEAAATEGELVSKFLIDWFAAQDDELIEVMLYLSRIFGMLLQNTTYTLWYSNPHRNLFLF